MSDWFDNNRPQTGGDDSSLTGTNSGEQTNEEERGVSSFAGADPGSVPPAADQGSSAPQAEQPTQAPSAQETGWSSTSGYTHSPYPSQTPPYQSSGAYRPGSGYDPYGWQRPQPPMQTQPPKPPKKKKSVTGFLIGGLAVICAGTIITLSVLLAIAMNDKTSPSKDTSSPSVSQSGTPGGSPSSTPDRDVNENAPTLDISGNDDDAEALTTRQIVQQNMDSTVVLTMYEKMDSYFGEEQYQLSGGASGIVMTEDGYIITNRHCVINEDSADQHQYGRIDVTTHDGTVYENAEVIGTDQYTDLAVIKINASGLQPAEFGNSSDMFLGDRVVAIGNAGGLQWTVTQGILSGVGRDVYDDTDYSIKCLQIDAAINPGNSGGPLFNAYGQVVGINSAKLRTEYGYEGLAFAIPINEAKPVIDDLLKYGYVRGRVMLSISGIPFSSYGYDSGFQIKSINSDSVFQGTQVKVGDVITHIAGVRVMNASELSAELSKHQVGEQVEITLYRINAGSRQQTSFTVTVTLVESRGN